MSKPLAVTELIGELTQLELQGLGGLTVFIRQPGIDRRAPIFGMVIDRPNHRVTLTMYEHEAQRIETELG
jgi:hypothetical protein